jgi:IclR family KDG regulon transcriptional repressor
MAQLVQALQRAMQILSSFDHEHPEMGVADLARKVDLPKPTVYRILATLQSGGFVQQNLGNDRYHLGLQLAMVGLLARDQLSPHREALPFMRALLAECQETVSLAVFDGSGMFYLEVLESPQAVKIAAGVGRRLPVHCTGTGKAYLAFIDEEELEEKLSVQRLDTCAANRPESLSALREDLRLTRERGYSVSQSEFEDGITGMGAPVMDDNGDVLVVIGVAGPAYRLSADRIDQIGEAVKRTAQELTQYLQAQPSRHGRISRTALDRAFHLPGLPSNPRDGEQSIDNYLK